MQGILTNLALDFGLFALDHAEYAWFIPIALHTSSLTELGNITPVSGNRNSLIQGFGIWVTG